MGSYKPIFAILVKTLLLLSLISPYHAIDDKVTLSLYYESLCPFCADFIANHLGKIFETDLFTIVNLRLIPWGNTQRVNNTWICQHGPDECALDVVEACAIHVWPKPSCDTVVLISSPSSIERNSVTEPIGHADVTPSESLLQEVHFKLIQCIEQVELKGRQNDWKPCYGALNLDPKPHSDCYTTKTGIDLALKYADETDHLNPPHKYVPWVLVNNKPIQEDYMNFVAYICKAYTGLSKPKSCQSRFKINSLETTNTTNKVCYR